MADFGDIVIRSIDLRGQAPAAWENFLSALKVYQAELITDLVRSPPESLVRAQARVQAVGELVQTMHDAPKLKEKFRNAR